MICQNANTTEAQRLRILDWLQHQSLSTLQARCELDVMHPAARIMELRNQGYQIITLRQNETTNTGASHSVARYILMQVSNGEVYAPSEKGE